MTPTESITTSFPPLNLPMSQLRIRWPQHPNAADPFAPSGAQNGTQSERPEVLCQCRKRYVALTPEEWVRQHFIAFMISHLGFPQPLIGAEVQLLVGANLRQRADIVVFSRQMKPLIIVECKAPCVPISQKTLNQVCRYLSSLAARCVVLTNGLEHFCIALDAKGNPMFRKSLPTWGEVLEWE